MLFQSETLAGIAAGEIDLAFRRWPRARVKAGTQLRTAIGVLEVVAVEVVDAKRLGARDARRAGFASREALRRRARRVRLGRRAPDPAAPRAAPIRASPCARAQTLSADERAELERRLDRMAGARALLALIAASPACGRPTSPRASAASCVRSRRACGG